jgi:hypothetical protein
MLIKLNKAVSVTIICQIFLATLAQINQWSEEIYCLGTRRMGHSTQNDSNEWDM